ncbi:hypothetical protein T02_12757 [Trichinella nativa]|uniref:Uncharacterized protein n=1 Tax=Trichinella nativa TaxID=6335 RepID=A0A0V1L1Z5_9BILA|nr:hypothetical protein T02_12757 [Trichinella nativa]
MDHTDAFIYRFSPEATGNRVQGEYVKLDCCCQAALQINITINLALSAAFNRGFIDIISPFRSQ